MAAYHYVWLAWSSSFLILWAVLYVFLTLYLVFLLSLKFLVPGYISHVWNLKALLPWRPFGLPLEELLFGYTFGMYWSSAYEYITWRYAMRAL